MADILRIADFSPGVSRYALIQGKLNIARRYHSKTIDRALKMLVKANFLTSTGASGKTNGELYSRRI